MMADRRLSESQMLRQVTDGDFSVRAVRNDAEHLKTCGISDSPERPGKSFRLVATERASWGA
ncbi:hypothetical protein GCM10008097_21440 [Mycetocola manganoxydans]|nr:hypothetical protein GCM10008097_21440 [Mycetocola manganoxydans]